MRPEQVAREKIDQLLTQAGWQSTLEVHAPGSRSNGFIDYLLRDQNDQPVALLEAKPIHTDPLAGKEQARDYAKSAWNLQYVILSNGETHYAWDTRNGNPTCVLSIPSLDRITRLMSKHTPNRTLLWTTPVDSNYLPDNSRRIMRPYQVAAVNAVQNAAKESKTSHLLEMATGTGKTTVAAAIIYLYISTGNAERVMFLVDRIELKLQAANDLRAALDNQYTVDLYDGQLDYNWDSTHVTVISIQTLDKMKNLPKTHFDLIVTDEAHRCISGPHRRDLFVSLEGEKIGLTATPRAVLNAETTDNSRFVQDQCSLRDTYVAFGLFQREPTYSYTMEDGRRDGYLVGPTAADVRTDITRRLISEKGMALDVPVDGFDESEEEKTETRIFHASDYGREFFSPATRREIAEAIIDQVLCERETGLIGKTIAYTASQKEAHALAQTLNEVAMKKQPGVYQSDFAVAITADVHGASEYGRQFRNNDLHGTHPDAPGRHTSKTRVCVTVAMMTTGYDCPDLLNIAICRTMYSPTEFTQVKGRGTRKYDFRDNITDIVEREMQPPYPKKQFKIIDFFGVCETHNEGHIYESRILNRPADNGAGDSDSGGGKRQRTISDAYIYRGTDEVESITELELAADAHTITRRRTADVRDDMRHKRETTNADLRTKFVDYLNQHPITDEVQREAARNLFESYVTDVTVRAIIDKRHYARLNGTTLPQSTFQLVSDEHRNRIVTYAKTMILASS